MILYLKGLDYHPTYEELKQGSEGKVDRVVICYHPTYEELKHVIITSTIFLFSLGYHPTYKELKLKSIF